MHVCLNSSLATCYIDIVFLKLGLPQSEVNAMALGLSHSLSRYKLKFSPDKVDTMIVQAIGEFRLHVHVSTYILLIITCIVPLSSSPAGRPGQGAQ